jgi:hypothetical protein
MEYHPLTLNVRARERSTAGQTSAWRAKSGILSLDTGQIKFLNPSSSEPWPHLPNRHSDVNYAPIAELHPAGLYFWTME